MNYDSEAILANPDLHTAARASLAGKTVVVDRNGNPVSDGVYDPVTTLITVQTFGRQPVTGALIQEALTIQVVEPRENIPSTCTLSVFCTQRHDHDGDCDPILDDRKG